MSGNFRDINAVILCGGQGLRLRPLIHDRPKSMASINRRPFLDILIKRLVQYGIKRLILCVGYKAGMIFDYYANKKSSLEIVYSHETRPLGTGGALKKAKKLINSETFLAMNGDTICDINLNSFLRFHIRKGALLSMALVRAEQSSDFGSVSLDKNSRITGFQEKKDGETAGLVNAGIYFMEKDIFLRMPGKERFSLEGDLFPGILNFKCYGFVNNHGFMLDIGTPQRYRQALGMAKKI